jgi:DNA (cytosine-5)-methyltransferase 1
MPQAISLFSGCGGCSLGLLQAGIDVVLAVDIDRDACETYKSNFQPEMVWPGIDLATIQPQALLERAHLAPGQIDLIVGGPPCQGFSSAGAKDWDDPRNTLLRHFVEIVLDLRPTWFIMENVEGLLTANGGIFIIEAITRFLEAGYWVRARKVYLEQFGLPQKRKRVLVVGNLERCDFDFPAPTHDQYPELWSERPPLLTVMNAIGDLPAPSDADTIRYDRPPLTEYQKRMRQGSALSLRHHQAKEMSRTTQQRIHLLKQGETMKHLPQELQHPSFTRRAFRRVMDGTPTERRGGAPSGLQRLCADAPSLTITSASPLEFIHPIEDRPLTLRECARIQSFPDWFVFHGSWSSIATQIGNAIPPLFMEQLAAHMQTLATWRQSGDTRGRWLGIQATRSAGMSPVLIQMLKELEQRTLLYA